MRSRLHRDPRWSHIGEPLLNRFRDRPEATTIDDFSVLVKGAVMAPDIAKVDADRNLDLGPPAWDFSDGVMRWLLPGNCLLLLLRTCSSHLRLTIAQREQNVPRPDNKTGTALREAPGSRQRKVGCIGVLSFESPQHSGKHRSGIN